MTLPTYGPSSRHPVILSRLTRFFTQLISETSGLALEETVSLALGEFFRTFPLPFRDEHIHLSGSLDADFVYPRLAPLLESPAMAARVKEIYGPDTTIRSARDVAP